jgi:hypothetical protein
LAVGKRDSRVQEVRKSIRLQCKPGKTDSPEKAKYRNRGLSMAAALQADMGQLTVEDRTCNKSPERAKQ